MTKAIIVILTLATAASAQRVTTVVPARPPSSSRSPAIPRIEQGSVRGNAYRNPSIGIELFVADGLSLGEPELKGTPGTVPLLVTVTALRSESLVSPRKVTAFYADALAYYPETQRSTDAYMRKVIRGNRQTGYELDRTIPTFNFGGMTFARQDFHGPLYEAVLVKSCDALAFVLIFASSDRGTVDKLIGETNLKADPLRSGCKRQ